MAVNIAELSSAWRITHPIATLMDPFEAALWLVPFLVVVSSRRWERRLRVNIKFWERKVVGFETFHFIIACCRAKIGQSAVVVTLIGHRELIIVEFANDASEKWITIVSLVSILLKTMESSRFLHLNLK